MAVKGNHKVQVDIQKLMAALACVIPHAQEAAQHLTFARKKVRKTF